MPKSNHPHQPNRPDSEHQPEEASAFNIPIIEAVDSQIVMHREAHFAGQFSDMLEYYMQGGKGVCADFELKRIQELADIEVRLKENLAGVLLSAADADKIAAARQMYQDLREICEVKNPRNKYPRFIAELILAEEEFPEKEIQAIMAEKSAIVPDLIALLRSEEMYDPLFPGYGLAPQLVAQCLGLIGDKRAVIALFEILGDDDFFFEEGTLRALKAVGEPAKNFLLMVVKGRPYNQDNVTAALALLQFKELPEVALACFALLQLPEVQANLPLATYLVLACEGLLSAAERQAFLSLSATMKGMLRRDMEAIAHIWKE